MPQPTVDDETIFDHLVKGAGEGRTSWPRRRHRGGQKARRRHGRGDLSEQLCRPCPHGDRTAPSRKIEGDKATVWASTQTPFAAGPGGQAIGCRPQNVHVITPFLGGGFGGKSRNLQAIEAARLAKAVGKPVQVGLERARGVLRRHVPAGRRRQDQVRHRQGGEIVFWDYGVYLPASAARAVLQHPAPSHGFVWRRLARASRAHPFATGPWRAPGNNTNTFARESQIDAWPPRRAWTPWSSACKNLADERMIARPQGGGRAFGWTPAKAPSGRGFGVACGMDAGTYVAAMAEVAGGQEDGPRPGQARGLRSGHGPGHQPRGREAPDGGRRHDGPGLCADRGDPLQGRPDQRHGTSTPTSCRVSPGCRRSRRCSLPANDLPPQGGGEPAIICMGAVIANAIHDATGARLFQLPMTEARLRKALAARTGQPAFVA